MIDGEPDRPWRWRNCRGLGIAVWFHILPWQWRIGAEVVGSTYTEFRAGVQFGPLGLQIDADIGNRSDEGWRARFALSEEQAWERSE